MVKAHPSIAGVVLAGGRSSRMGQNKAMLDYHGQPLVSHMVALLQQVGIARPLISGTVHGYDCLPDHTSFQGPGIAMANIMTSYPAPAGYLFVPVDMPLLNAELLQRLLHQPGGSYFQGYPLPAYFVPPYRPAHVPSVRDLLALYAVLPIALPGDYTNLMRNFNTSEEWQEFLQS